MSEITRILAAAQAGHSHAAEELLPLVYNELRRLAAFKMAQEQPGQTLQPTALVHEAWLRLGADCQPDWESRAHFFGAAAYFAAVWLGESLKLAVLASRVSRVAKRFFGVPEFHYYALADGIAVLLSRLGLRCPLCPPAPANPTPDPQRAFAFW